MADDHNSRYRTSDPFGRGPSSAASGNDPLSELARLIGQNDPFSEHGRDSAAPAQRDTHYGNEPAPQYGTNSGYASNSTPSYSSDPAFYGNEPAPQFGGNSHRDQQAYQNNHSAPAYNDYAQPFVPERTPSPSPSYGESYAAPAANDSFSANTYQNQYTASSFPQPTYPQETEGGPMPPPHGDDFYDDAPRNSRRKGLLTVMAVLGLAVIGTAGAFGYRSLFGSVRSGSPPVIKASGEPSKVAPPAASADSSTSKINYDRFGDRSQNEQVVGREEQPLDAKDLARSAVPRGSQPSSSAATPATGAAPSALGEPRRVRTVPIKPDATDASAAAASSRTQPPAPSTAAPQRQAVVVLPSINSQDLAPTAETPPHATARSRSSRTASRSTASPGVSSQSSPAPAGNAPLSLSPDSSNALPAPSAAREVPAPPLPRVTPPPSSRSSSSAPSSGGYLVQVSSQKSETDAESAYRNIQTKYASVIGSHQHVIRRADLGAKGVYFRAMVGPVGTREQAIQLCSSLKAAGGDCVVQAN